MINKNRSFIKINFLNSLYISLEFFLIGLFFISKEYINFFESLQFIFIWILINYIFGKYSKDSNYKKPSFFREVFMNFSSFLVVVNIFILMNRGNFEINSFWIFTKDNFWIPILTSFLGLFLVNFYSYKKFHTKWLILCNEELISNLYQEFKNELSNILLIRIDKLDDLNNTDSKKFNGIILTEKNNANQYKLLREKLSSKIKIIKLNEWIEQSFFRIPTLTIREYNFFQRNNYSFLYRYQILFKRLGDIIFSFTLLIITSPIVIISSFFIFLEDKGPIIYSQIRSGENNTEIRIYKLRTMYLNAEDNGAKWAQRKDSRITNIGNILRRLRIDELPQLWNVIVGEMSLIGPRPERPEFDQMLKQKIPKYNSRYSFKPGLSGWAQVNYPYGSSVEDAAKKLSYDLFYIKNFSLYLDFLILFKTIRLVFSAEGALPKNG